MTPTHQAVLAVSLVLASASAFPQSPSPAAPAPVKAKIAYYIDPMVLDLTRSIPPPPEQGSPRFKAELAELHRIEQERTPAQVAAAQADDKEEDIFIFRNVVGDGFRAEDLPLTAALSAHVHNDEPVAGNAIKSYFNRPRPYQFDKTLHPVCKTTEMPDSYPSGHSISGYLLALTLIQILPEKQAQILERADDYAHNRLVCGVHYASDPAASRVVAYAVFGYMLATPRFQKDLAAAREETRRQMGLPAVPSHP